MKRMLTLSLLVLSAAFTFHADAASAQDHESKIEFGKYGFEMTPLEVKSDKSVTAVQMFLEPYGGFAANVSVQMQYYAGNLGGYVAQAKEQIDKNGWQLIAVDTVDNWPGFEYKGESGRKQLHFYQRAFKRENTVYVVLATALESRWNEEKKALLATVNSFKLMKAPDADQPKK